MNDSLKDWRATKHTCRCCGKSFTLSPRDNPNICFRCAELSPRGDESEVQPKGEESE